MRVSTSQIYNIANIGMRDAQVEVDKTHQQISTGRRVLSPADDPVAATGILSLNQELSRLTQFSKNIDTANNNLSLEDTTLQSVVSLVQRLKELAVSAGNTAVLSASDYKAIAAEVDGALNGLLQLQNTRNASGQYIFAGFQSQIQPFVNTGGGNYIYQGDEGQLYVQASTTISVAVTDSGKRIFMDLPSSNNTFTTLASSSNRASPAAIISVGDVYDQSAFDKLFPEDMLVTFNAMSAVIPPSPNYTVTERTSGKIIVEKQVYISGQDIEVNGARFSISGSPYAGIPSTPATIPLGTFTATDFSVTNATIDITVGGVTETLTLDQNITTNAGPDSLNKLLTALGGGDKTFYDLPINAGTEAAKNFKKLQNLGITLTGTGFSSPNGLNISIKNGALSTDALLGLTTQTTGTTSMDGVIAQAGDKFVIESTGNQGLLTTVSRFSEAMKNVTNTQNSKEDLAKIVARTLVSLENAMTNIAAVQGDVGARQNLLDSSKDLNADVELNSREILSQLEDLDYAEASTRLQMQTFVLSAAQQSFIKISELSLFKYL